MKRQGKRTDLTSDQIGRKLESREVLAKQVGESKIQISRYIRLTYLIDKFLDMVDSKKMPLNVGVELSYLGSKAQSYIAELLGVMSMELSYFESTAPIISEILSVFIALGWALLIGNLVFQCLKAMMSDAGFEAEDPKILFLRTFVFAFLLLASRQICYIGSSITGTVINMLELPKSITVTTPDESMFSLGSGAKWLFVIIVGVVLMVQMVKLLFEIGERYVITSVLTFFAPLAFAMGGSKSTNDIFKGWVRMYCSMLVMMIMNIVFFKADYVGNVADGGRRCLGLACFRCCTHKSCKKD